MALVLISQSLILVCRNCDLVVLHKDEKKNPTVHICSSSISICPIQSNEEILILPSECLPIPLPNTNPRITSYLEHCNLITSGLPDSSSPLCPAHPISSGSTLPVKVCISSVTIAHTLAPLNS